MAAASNRAATPHLLWNRKRAVAALNALMVCPEGNEYSKGLAILSTTSVATVNGLGLATTFFKIRFPRIKVSAMESSIQMPHLLVLGMIANIIDKHSQNTPAFPRDVINIIILSRMGLCHSEIAYKICNSTIFLP